MEKRRKNRGREQSSLPTPNSIVFSRFWESPGEAESTKNRKNGMHKSCVFLLAKKSQKIRKKNKICAARQDARCQWEVGGLHYSAKVCMLNENHAKEYHAEFMQEFMQELCRHLARAQGAADSNATRIPPSQYWLLGGLEVWR